MYELLYYIMHYFTCPADELGVAKGLMFGRGGEGGPILLDRSWSI